MPSNACNMIEDGFLDFSKIVETRRAFYASETDMIHRCKDGSFVYEENWFDLDDDLGKARNFRQLARALPAAWEKALPMEEEYCDWQHTMEDSYMEELELEKAYLDEECE